MTPIRVRIAARETFGNGLLHKPTEGYVVAFENGLAVVVLDNGSFHHVSLDKLAALTPVVAE